LPEILGRVKTDQLVSRDGQKSVEERLRYAAVLVEIGELYDAEGEVAGALDENADSISALDLLAKIKHMRGELTEAIACWVEIQNRCPPDQAALMSLRSMMQLARETEGSSEPFVVYGPFQLWRKPAAHLEIEEVFRLFLARRPDEARARCQELAAKYRERDPELYKLATLANAWLAELSGDVELARSILEALGGERGFETDPDRVIALARLYEQIGSSDLLEKAVHIYEHLDRRSERVSVLGRLASLERKLGQADRASRYEARFLELFRLRMHRVSRADVVQTAARRYVPLYKLTHLASTGSGATPSTGPRERAIGLALGGRVDEAAGFLDETVTLDSKYLGDLAVLGGDVEEAVRRYLRVLARNPDDLRVIEWLLSTGMDGAPSAVKKYFRQADAASRTAAILDRAVRRTPLRASLWRERAALHRLLGEGEDATRCLQRAGALEEAAQRARQPIGRALAAAVYHFSGKSKGLVHEVWTARRPADPGTGGFLDEILGNLTSEMIQGVRNTFLSVREYARAKWPERTRDILNWTYTYKVTKEDEPSGGLSAGLPSALAFLSLFLQHPMPQSLAASGALVTDAHDVLMVRPVGEAEYKVRGAYNRNLDRLILPEGNRRELQSSPLVPQEIAREVVRHASSLDEAVVHTWGDDVWLL
jgi:tetratricopeptide (TPR) repeat protein